MSPHCIYQNVDNLAVMMVQKNDFGFHGNRKTQGHKHQLNSLYFKYQVCQIKLGHFNTFLQFRLFSHKSHCSQNGKSISFWGSSPKGRYPVGHRGEFPDVHPVFRPSACSSVPPWPSKPWILSLRPDLGPLSPQIRHPSLKSALQASNQLSRLQISSQGLKSALQATNLISRPQISVPCLKSAVQVQIVP